MQMKLCLKQQCIMMLKVVKGDFLMGEEVCDQSLAWFRMFWFQLTP